MSNDSAAVLGGKLTGSEIATVRQGVALAATTAASVIQIYRARNTVARGDLALLRVYSERTVALAKVSAAGDVSRAIMQEIIETSRMIEALPPGNIAIPFAMDQLDHLHRRLRRIIDGF